MLTGKQSSEKGNGNQDGMDANGVREITHLLNEHLIHFNHPDTVYRHTLSMYANFTTSVVESLPWLPNWFVNWMNAGAQKKAEKARARAKKVWDKAEAAARK